MIRLQAVILLVVRHSNQELPLVAPSSLCWPISISHFLQKYFVTLKLCEELYNDYSTRGSVPVSSRSLDKMVSFSGMSTVAILVARPRANSSPCAFTQFGIPHVSLLALINFLQRGLCGRLNATTKVNVTHRKANRGQNREESGNLSINRAPCRSMREVLRMLL